MICYQRERIHDLWDEVADLIDAHYAEIAHYHDIPLNPDVAAYCALEDAGNLRVFTAREHSADGQMIGYCVYMVRNNIHYQQSLQAVQDVLFIHPQHRRGSVGSTLIRFADAALAVEGVQVVYQHVKAAHNFGRLLERQGYELVDLIYARRLDRGDNSSSGIGRRIADKSDEQTESAASAGPGGNTEISGTDRCRGEAAAAQAAAASAVRAESSGYDFDGAARVDIGYINTTQNAVGAVNG